MVPKKADKGDGPRSIPVGSNGDAPEEPLKGARELAEERAEHLLKVAEEAEEAGEAPDAAADVPEGLPSAPELFERLQKSKADFANYQKRVERDRKSWAAGGKRSVLSGLLPALDALEITVRSAEDHDDYEGLKAAVEIVMSEVHKFLGREGVERVPGVGETFDPEHHEALFNKPTDEAEPGVVLEEVRPGYMLGDMVLRASQVIVSAAPQAEESAAPEEAADDPPADGEE